MTIKQTDTVFRSLDIDPDTGELRAQTVDMKSVPLLIEHERCTHDGTPHRSRWTPSDIAVVARVGVSREEIAHVLRQLADTLSLDPRG